VYEMCLKSQSVELTKSFVVYICRPGSIQTRSQIVCIREFAKFLWPSRIIFSSV